MVSAKAERNATPAASAPLTRRVSAPVGNVIDAVVGSSTGGPVALETMLAQIPTPLPVPMFVAQHMPPMFTELLAERLDRQTSSTVVEAQHGMTALPGTVYIAPGGRHMEVQRLGGALTIVLNDGPLVNFCRPSVDVLFSSTATTLGNRQLGVMLTGMGQDGLAACRELAAAGVDIIAQDEASSVVWGMPGAVATAGLATSVLPLDEIGPSIQRRVASTHLLARR